MVIMWPRKKLVSVPDDTGEAREYRAEAERELAVLQAQAFEVESLTRKLQRRRLQNHFGRDISVTFRPRGGHQ